MFHHLWLSQHNACDKHVFVTTKMFCCDKIKFCHDKHTFVMTSFVTTNMCLSWQNFVTTKMILAASPANDTNGWWGSWLIQCLKGRPTAVPRLTAGYRIVGIIALEENLCCLCSVSRRVALAGIGGNIFWQRSAVQMTVTCAVQCSAVQWTSAPPTHRHVQAAGRKTWGCSSWLLHRPPHTMSEGPPWQASCCQMFWGAYCWLWWLQMCSWCVLDCPQCQPFCFTSTEVRLLIRDGDWRVGEGERMKSEG